MKSVVKDPVWVQFPFIPWGSIGWRMGPGEVYWHEWIAWFRSVSPELQASYQTQWPEPAEWDGLYAFILHGVAPPRIHAQRTTENEQQPPRLDEHRIDEPNSPWQDK